MDKKRVLQAIVQRLREDAKTLLAAAQASREAATHADSKAENKYDTRGLEASYLAGAQARKAEEGEEAVIAYERLEPRDFTAADPIGLGALVEVRLGGFVDLYFVGPAAGGVEVEVEGRECTVITRESPMGKKLLGAREGSRFEVNGREGMIVSVV